MESSTSLGVFKGPDSLTHYFDPDRQPLLPLVELPAALNPLRHDGVRIFAKMLTALPAQNVKSLPALNMLRNQPESRKRTIVEASSGSTALSLGMISKATWGHEDVHAYVTNKKHVDSLRTLRFFGLKPVLYGGLAQQEPSDPKGIMNRLRNMQKENPEEISYPGQYENDYNWKAHEQWTGAQIWKQLPEINVLCTTVGTGGCITGTGKYLKSKKADVQVVGVCNVFGDPTPGPRHFPGFESSQFPWRQNIDTFETVSSVDSYRWSMKLSQYGIICGPSSGEALQGLLSYLEKAKSKGRLQDLADPESGEISCVFICADLPYQYMDLYFKKLDDSEFPPIVNRELLTCDLDAYDERWFLTPEQACEMLSSNPTKPLPSVLLERHLCVCKKEISTTIPSPPSTSDSEAAPCSGHTTPNDNKNNNTRFDLPSPHAAPSPTHTVEPSPTIIDIRPRHDYETSHIQGSLSLPLTCAPTDFFGNPEAVRNRWIEMTDGLATLFPPHDDIEASESDQYDDHDHDHDEPVSKKRKFSHPQHDPPQNSSRNGGGGNVALLFVCADGDSGKMAAAMARGKGKEAFCVDGGFSVLVNHLHGLRGGV